jgi:GNAT superfamily N-acetyltransferase
VTIREILPSETGLAFPALQALRPHFASEADLVRRIDEVQRAEGYRLVGAFEPDRAHAIAVAGFRVGHNLAWGRRFLYVDDLSTLPEGRGRGHARGLLGWLAQEARRLDCAQLHLDSGLGADRVAAHRLYFNAGLQISAYHFARALD